MGKGKGGTVLGPSWDRPVTGAFSVRSGILIMNLSDRIRERKVVFLVGSGISTGYPSCLPSAKQLLSLSAEHYLPEQRKHDIQQIIEFIQPEIFYQELSYFMSQEALSSFHLLDCPNAKPTLAHFLIVALAHAASVPVITTNFDRLLEAAALDMGISAKVVGSEGPFSANSGNFEIWKVHGSVGQPLLALMPQITQPNVDLLDALATIAQGKHLCFIGYSGRDIDLFPQIRQFAGRNQNVWVDPYPNAALEARARSIGAFPILKCKFEDYASQQLPHVFDEISAKGVDVINLQVDHSAEAETVVRTAIAAEMNRLSSRGRISPDESALLLGICLSRVGRHDSALSYLLTQNVFRSASPGIGSHAAVIMARLADFLSDYRGSEKYARYAARRLRAFACADKPQMLSLKVQTLHAFAMSKKMQMGPHLFYPKVGMTCRPNLSSALRVLALYIWFTFRIRLTISKATGISRFRRLRSPPPSSNVWILCAWNRFLDHKTVLYALLITAVGRFSIFKVGVIKGLKKILIQAEQAGDTTIMAHTRKQLQQLGVYEGSDLEFVSSAYELTVDDLNLALVHRNSGDEYVGHGELQSAAREYCRMLRLAVKCKSKATILKAYVGLYACGKVPRAAIVKKRLTGLSGSGYEQFTNTFLRARLR